MLKLGYFKKLFIIVVLSSNASVYAGFFPEPSYIESIDWRKQFVLSQVRSISATRDSGLYWQKGAIGPICYALLTNKAIENDSVIIPVDFKSLWPKQDDMRYTFSASAEVELGISFRNPHILVRICLAKRLAL